SAGQSGISYGALGSFRLHRFLRPRAKTARVDTGAGGDGDSAGRMAASVRLLHEGDGLKRLIFAAVILGGIAFGAWKLNQWRNLPPEVSFTHATREPITSSVSTNGNAEPVELALARTERAGAA